MEEDDMRRLKKRDKRDRERLAVRRRETRDIERLRERERARETARENER